MPTTWRKCTSCTPSPRRVERCSDRVYLAKSTGLFRGAPENRHKLFSYWTSVNGLVITRVLIEGMLAGETPWTSSRTSFPPVVSCLMDIVICGGQILSFCILVP